MVSESPIDRNDVNAILEVLFDMKVLLVRIARLLGDDDEEEADQP